MTYSIKVKAPTRDECKQRLLNAFTVQTTRQPWHLHDVPHVKRFLYALIDLQRETPHEEIVVDAYGYVSKAGDGSMRMIALNVKVYSSPINGDHAIPIQLPPPGTF
jgi:hypothetical protein